MPEENKEPKADDILMSWQAHEYFNQERSFGWYIGGFICFVLLIVYAVITAAWTMAVAVGLMGAVVYLYAHERPEITDVYITKLGIHFRKYFYPYRELRSFWFISDTERNYHALVIESVDPKLFSVSIQVQVEDISDIRDVLLRELPEDTEKKESGIDRIARILKI